LNELLIKDCAKISPMPGSNNENISMTYNITTDYTGYALIDYVGEGATINLYKYSVGKNGNYKILDHYDGIPAISNGMGINYIIDGEKYIYFGNINATHWFPETDEVTPFNIDKITFSYDGGEIDMDITGEKGYIVILPDRMTDFTILDKNGDMIWNYEVFIKNGYKEEQRFSIKPKRG
jgi:hypothetical protein